MRELYIPRGKTVSVQNIEADRIINKGVLNVDGTAKARRILGDGILHAGHVSAGSVVCCDLEAGTVTAERVAADRIVVVELRASRSVVSNCYLEAGLVTTPKLTTRRHEVQELKCDKLVALPDKRGGMLWTVLSSQLRTAWAAVRYWWVSKTAPDNPEEAVDADYVQADEPATETKDVDWDFERRRLLSIFELGKEHGFVVRIMTPTESVTPLERRLKDAA